MECNWVKKAYKLKREDGISWTKIPGELEKITGELIPSHKIRDAVRAYEKKNKITNKEVGSLVININDVHIGKKTSSYNIDKTMEKIKFCFEELERNLKSEKKCKEIEDIHINFIGDIIDNDTLYPTQPHHVDKRNGRVSNATKQIKFGAEFFKDVINTFQKKTKVKIIINCVKGNHGRVSKFTEESNNYDIMFYDRLALALEGNKNIKFNISEDFYLIANIQNHGFLLNHGNGIKMYQNIPWYGLVQRSMRWAGSMPKQFDYVIVGHFHTSGIQYWNDKIIFLNGTCVEGDNFPMEIMGLKESNMFWGFVVTKNIGIEKFIRIDMSEI